MTVHNALAGVDPALLAPLQAAPNEWPDKPSRWRLELRQHLMSELRRTRWITYTRTPRSLQPGEQGRGWLRTDHPTDGGHPQHPVTGPHPTDRYLPPWPPTASTTSRRSTALPGRP